MRGDLIYELWAYWLTEKESRVYLTMLETWPNIASLIAKRSGFKRASTYEILSSLVKKWLVTETNKEEAKIFTAASPELLLQKIESKCERFKNVIPELLAVSWSLWSKPKVELYDWVEWLKNVFKKVLDEWDSYAKPFLSFLWTNIDMDPEIARFLKDEFMPVRTKYRTKTRVIASSRNSEEYLDFNIETHESLLIDDELFEMWNEIVVYAKSKVAILMYSRSEQSGLIIDSQTLHDWLESLFNLIWKYNNKKSC